MQSVLALVLHAANDHPTCLNFVPVVQACSEPHHMYNHFFKWVKAQEQAGKISFIVKQTGTSWPRIE